MRRSETALADRVCGERLKAIIPDVYRGNGAPWKFDTGAALFENEGFNENRSFEAYPGRRRSIHRRGRDHRRSWGPASAACEFFKQTVYAAGQLWKTQSHQ